MRTAEVVKSSVLRPLHEWSVGDVQNHPVSSISRWNDKRWTLDNPTPGTEQSTSTIAWNLALSDGTNLCDPCNADMLDWLRRFVWSLFVSPGDGATRLAPGTASQITVGLSTFVFWMNENAYRMPHELDRAALDGYLDDLPKMLDSRDEESDDDEGESIGYSPAYLRVRIPWLIWRQREALRAGGVVPMPLQPWGGESADSLAKRISTKVRGWVQPLPDEVAIPIMNKAAWFLGTPAEDVIALQAACLAAFERGFKSSRGNRVESNRVGGARAQLPVVEAFRFRTIRGDTTSWCEPLGSSVTVSGANPLYRLRKLVDAVVTAAVIAVQAGTGMRVSEICGLTAGVNSESGLPECVRVEESSSGLNEVFIVTTLLSKGEESPRKVDWVIGMRPYGNTDLPIPILALIILDRLLAPYRLMAKTDRLLVSLGAQNSLPRSLKTVAVIITRNIRDNVKNFVEHWVDLSQLPAQSEHYIVENNLVPWKESKGRMIKTHQFRKMFASFAFGVDARLLPALQMHFHHLSEAVTEGGYLGRNPIQLEPLEAVQRQQVTLLMYEAATGRSLLAGRQGEHLTGHISELSERIAGKSNTDGWREAVSFVDKYDLRMRFVPHGKCLPLVPVKMRCHELAGTVSWLNKEPNYDTREPNVCAGCFCFLIDKRNVGFWHDRYIQNRTSFLQAKARGEEKEFRVVRERARQARVLLIKLEVDVAEIDRALDAEIKSEFKDV